MDLNFRLANNYGFSLREYLIYLAAKSDSSYINHIAIPHNKELESESLNKVLELDTAIVLGADKTEGEYSIIYNLKELDAFVQVTCTKSKVTRLMGIFKNKDQNDKYEEKITSLFVDKPSIVDRIAVSFWYNTLDAPIFYDIYLEVPKWSDIRNNYSNPTKSKLEELINLTETNLGGKIILLTGKPGTGKTFFIRSLLNEWRNWTQANYVIDIEELFSQRVGYLVKLLGLGAQETVGGLELEKRNIQDGKNPHGIYRLLILEDSGEMISKDAKSVIGQNLTRLLNLSDGLLGQGVKLIILITTNEPVDSLNDAITRPGRCIANIQFTELSVNESNNWMKQNNLTEVLSGSKTIADLYEKKNKQNVIVTNNKTSIGFGG